MMGAGKRNRTSDLRFTKALLYLLSYAGLDLLILTFCACNMLKLVGMLGYPSGQRGRTVNPLA